MQRCLSPVLMPLPIQGIPEVSNRTYVIAAVRSVIGHFLSLSVGIKFTMMPAAISGKKDEVLGKASYSVAVSFETVRSLLLTCTGTPSL